METSNSFGAAWGMRLLCVRVRVHVRVRVRVRACQVRA